MATRKGYSQQEAISYLKKEQREKLFADIIRAEGEIVQFLNWAELPVTKKLRQKFSEFESKVLKVFKANKWTEAEGRGIAYLFEFTAILEEMIADSQKKLEQIRQRKQKEG